MRRWLGHAGANPALPADLPPDLLAEPAAIKTPFTGFEVGPAAKQA